MSHRLTSKQHQVLAAVAAGIVRCEAHKDLRSTSKKQMIIWRYFVGKEHITSTVRSLLYRGLVKFTDERLELVT